MCDGSRTTVLARLFVVPSLLFLLAYKEKLVNVESHSWLIEYDNPVQIYCHSFVFTSVVIVTINFFQLCYVAHLIKSSTTPRIFSRENPDLTTSTFATNLCTQPQFFLLSILISILHCNWKMVRKPHYFTIKVSTFSIIFIVKNLTKDS